MKLFHRKHEPVRLQKVQPSLWCRINYFCIENAGIILFIITLLIILTVISTCMIVGANGGCLESGNYYNHLKNI